MPEVKIILVDWGQYPIAREKKIADRVVYCGLERVLHGIAAFPAGISFNIDLIINDCPWFKKILYMGFSQLPFIQNIYFRGNDGFDFGAYDYGYQKLKNSGYAGEVVFMNSSVQGPSRKNWLRDYHQLFHQYSEMGVCGSGINSHATHISENISETFFAPHIQSFFLYTSMDILKNTFLQHLPGHRLTDKMELISNGEIAFSKAILERGYKIACLQAKDYFYKKNSDWKLPLGDLRLLPPFSQLANRI